MSIVMIPLIGMDWINAIPMSRVGFSWAKRVIVGSKAGVVPLWARRRSFAPLWMTKKGKSDEKYASRVRVER
jgi:hypothetical protein